VSHPGSDIAAYALQFLDGPAYEWGSSDAGPVAEFRRAVETGGTPDEIHARVWEWAAAEFERFYQAFRDARLLNTGVCLPLCAHDPDVP
jgi:hypothetical protein